MKTVSAIDFVRFLKERNEAKDGAFSGAKGFSPKELFSFPGFLSLDTKTQKKLKSQFEEKQQIWGDKEAVFDYYKQITGEKIYAPIQGIFTSWCGYFKDTSFATLPRTPGVFLFKKGASGAYSSLGIMFQPSYVGRESGNWQIFTFNMTTYELTIKFLNSDEWDAWGMPIKYFDYGKYSISLTDGNYFGEKVLRKGMRGDNILILQSCLAALGLLDEKVQIDGFFTSQIEEALKNFQKQYNLPQNGELDEKTCVALQTILEKQNECES